MPGHTSIVVVNNFMHSTEKNNLKTSVMYDYTMKAAPEHAGEYHQYHSNFHIL
jgi:hypothetical protein